MEKNILLISLDTARADVVYNFDLAGLQSLRDDFVVFDNAISSSPLTPISHTTVFTGLQPYNHGLRNLFKEKIPQKIATLPEILHAHGYSTSGVVSCPGMNKWYGFSRGFDNFDDEIPRLPDGSDPLKLVDVKLRGSALKRAPLVVEKSKQFMNNMRESSNPFFMFMHFFDAHWPYEAPEKHGGRNIYEEELAFSCFHLDQFLTWFKAEGFWEDTMVVIFSDHGEDLEGIYENDKGGAELGHPEEAGHGCLLYQQTQHVVLMVRDKDLPLGTSVEPFVRLVDIAPTILEGVGIDNTEFNMDGTSLFQLYDGTHWKSSGIPYCETLYPSEQNLANGNLFPAAKNKKAIIVEGRYKIIQEIDGDKVEVYDLKNDPNELNNLF